MVRSARRRHARRYRPRSLGEGVRRQFRVEVVGEGVERRHALQEVPERDPDTERFLDGLAGLRQRERVEAESQERRRAAEVGLGEAGQVGEDAPEFCEHARAARRSISHSDVGIWERCTRPINRESGGWGGRTRSTQ